MTRARPLRLDVLRRAALVLAIAGALPVSAQELPRVAAAHPAAERVSAARDPDLLLLAAGAIDPLRERIDDPIADRAPLPPQAYTLVQFEGRPAAAVAALRRAGIAVVAFVPNRAFLVAVPGAQRGQLAAIDGVRWIGDWAPAYKVSPGLRAALASPRDLVLSIIGFPDGDPAALRAALAPLGAAAKSALLDAAARAPEYRVALRSQDLADAVEQLARHPLVAALEPFELPVPNNNLSVGPIQSNQSSGGAVPTPQAASIWTRGITGTGQIVTVADSGLDRNQGFFNRYWNAGSVSRAIADAVPFTPPVPAPVDLTRKVVGYFITPGASAYDDNVSCSFPTGYHGTHVVGTVAGDSGTAATPSAANYDPGDGMAPHAQILFMDIGNDATGCLTGDSSPNMHRTARAAGSFISSNSYGSSFANSPNYNARDASIDQVLWEQEDYLILFAAGNAGPNGPSINHPAHAKNVVTVGATARGDTTTLASFSSRGPTADGRRKPDIVAPGAGIVSAAGDDDDANPPLNMESNRTKAISGTSMATPTVAGGTALLRQYFTDGWYPTGTATVVDRRAPLGAEMKAVMLNGTAMFATAPDINFGWGRMFLDNNLYFAGDARRLRSFARRHADGIEDGDVHEYRVEVAAGHEFRATLAWFDPPGIPGAARALVNDLDLEVRFGPDTWRGNVFSGAGATAQSATGGAADTVDPVEQVRLLAPAAGVYTIRVIGSAVPGNGVVGSARQGYALVVSGGGVAGAPTVAPSAPSLVVDGDALVASVAPVSGATGYQLYRAAGTCSAANPLDFQLVAHAGQPNALRDRGTQGGFVYAYRVRATNERGEGPASACTTVVSQAPCTLLPQFDANRVEITQAGPGSCSNRLQWIAGSSRCPAAPDVRYSIYRSTDPFFAGTATDRLADGVSGTSFVDAGTQPGVTYFYAVRAEDGTGDGSGPNGGNLSAGFVRLPFSGVGRPQQGTFSDGADGWSLLRPETPWYFSAANAASGTLSYRTAEPGATVYEENTCAAITSPPLRPSATSVLAYKVRHELELSWDGVVTEVSVDGGPWVDLPPAGGYPGALSETLNPPINACRYPATQGAFTGSTGGLYRDVSTPLSAFSGREVRVRWRFTSDPNIELAGFHLDDVSVSNALVPAQCVVDGTLFVDGFDR